MPENKIKLVSLHEGIKEEYLSLKVYNYQETFVESPKESLADKEKHAWNICWTIDCIYADNQMIGYAMHGMDSAKNVWLDRFMIDRRYQHKGYGTQALTQLLDKMKTGYPGRKHILLSVEKHNASAIQMYEKFGFKKTDEMDGIYPVMILSEAQSTIEKP